MKNNLNFDTSSYDVSDSYDETYYFLNNYYGEANFIENLLSKNGMELNKSKFLDLGCGTGNLIAHLDKGIQKVGIDISPKLLSKAKEKKIFNSEFILGNLTDLKLNDKFDIILISTYILQTFQSLIEIEKFVKSIRINLNKGGKILFSWISEEDYSSQYNDGAFEYMLNSNWNCKGISKFENKRRYLEFNFTNNNKDNISSSASYIPFNGKILYNLASKINMKLEIFNGKENFLKEDYQHWGSFSEINLK